MDAIAMLKDDHKTVKALFRDFDKATAPGRKQRLVERMIEELSVHAALEEQIFYPAARQTLQDDDEIVLEALEEHHIVKWTLSELEDMEPGDERFDAKVKVMAESVKHHIKEEEEQMFPKLRARLGRKRLQEIGEAMEAAKPMAPRRPHPRLPDQPPGNVITGMAAGAADRVIDITKDKIGQAKKRMKRASGQ